MSEPVRQRGDTASQLLTLRILHAAMIASIAIYGLVLLTVTRAGPAGDPVPASEIELSAPRGQPPGPGFTIALAIVAAVTAAAIFFIRARALRRRRPGLYDDGAAAPPPPAHRPRLEYFTLCILSWAMAETIAVYGLVLGFLHHALLPFVPFAGASLLLMIVLTPRRSHVVAGSDAPP
jgi:F0F1-type ATP synthase membrane subunit c/vacuolar-type H+-ATPase subunit K